MGSRIRGCLDQIIEDVEIMIKVSTINRNVKTVIFEGAPRGGVVGCLVRWK